MKMMRLLLAAVPMFILFAATATAQVSSGPQEFRWQEEFKHPLDEYRIFHLWHHFDDKFEAVLNAMHDYGFRGVVTNNAWDDNYIRNSSNYAILNAVIDQAKKRGMTVWLYDEYGYPSGTADRQTLDGHPEYEAIGIGLLSGEYTEKAEFALPEAFQKIIYAEIVHNGKKTPGADLASFEWSERTVKANAPGVFTLNVYAQKIAFEGSHAEKNGFRPNRYPNLLNREAVKRFIDLVYTGYKNNVANIGDKVQAIFTDEPSLMTHFVNTRDKYPHFIVPWEDRLPARFKEMHGYDLLPQLSSLFNGDTDEDKILRVNFYQTVAEMMTQSFYIPLRDYCEEMGIAFSGHNLLEERLSWHVGLYGDMMKNIGTMQIPGIDVLSGVPSAYLAGWFMTPKYVSSAARNNGKDVVMVEFCPVTDKELFRIDEFQNVLGTTSLLFFHGANRFNTYYAYNRMTKENANKWNDYSGRLNTLLRGATFASEIAVLYPIANTQAYFTAENTHFSYPSARIQALDLYINRVATQLFRNQLDFNILDADSLENATIETGRLVVGNGAYRVMVLPDIEVMSLESMKKLTEFADAGGRVIWLDALPRLATRAKDTAELRRLAEKFRLDVISLSARENLAARSLVTASDTDAGYSPNNVVITGNSDPASWMHWSSTKTPAWLELELDGAKTFDYFELYTKSGYELTSFSVSYLDSNGNWHNLVESVKDNTETVRRFEFEPVTAQKLKIDMPTGSKAQANIPRVNQIMIGLTKKEGEKKRLEFTDIIKDTVKHNIRVVSGSERFGDLFVSPYIKEGKKIYYVVNSNKDDIDIDIVSLGPFDLYDPYTGDIVGRAGTSGFVCKGYRGYFIVER